MAPSRTSTSASRLPAVTAVARGRPDEATTVLGAALKALRLQGALRRAGLDARPAVVHVCDNPLAGGLLEGLTSLLGVAGVDGVTLVDGTRTAADLPEGSVLRGVELPTAWSQDALRVLVTTVATDPVDGFTGACAALLDLLPPDCAVPGTEAVVELLHHCPPHLVIVDAMVGSDGCFGRGERATHTVVAGTSAVAVDEVLAALMGVDPAVSPVVAQALSDAPLPVPRQIVGDVRPWAGWRPAPRELTGACRRAAEVLPVFGRVLRDLVADAPADEADTVLRTARRWLGPSLARADDDPVALSGLVVAVEAFAFWAAAGRAWATVVAKDRLPRREVSLGLDLGSYRAADYDAVADYMAPLMQLAEQAAPRAGGLRWQRHGRGVLFLAERELDAPYDDFVARVDLSRTIRLMNDYIGGAAAVVARDRQGRVLRQAERNLYLPQPNYVVFAGGDVIDVCKLEVLRYGENERSIAWRTLRSPNGSAVHDDGAVRFRAAGRDRTCVSVYGLQEFTLPPFWQTVDLERYPALHDALTDDAYRRFFSATLDNFEAAYEGREVSTGRAVRHDPEPPTARLSRTLALAAEALTSDDSPSRLRRPARVAREVDDDGFHHVRGGGGQSAGTRATLARGSSPVQSVVADLRVALERDLGRDARP